MTFSPHITTQGKGKPIVLFHGWGFDSQIWLPLLPTLINQYQLHLVDLPGFGLTPHMEWEAFKSALLKHLPAKFALVGWSMGGLLATRLAIEEPENVTHLINVASSPYFIRETPWPGIAPTIFRDFYQAFAINSQQILQEFITLQLQGQKVLTGQPPSLNGLRAGLDLLMRWDLRQNLTQLNQPVCYMFGRLDAIVPHATMVTMQTLYPDFHYVMFPKAAHAPFLSHQNEFITALERFLQ